MHPDDRPGSAAEQCALGRDLSAIIASSALPPIRRNLGYRLALVPVALTMLLLPGIYLALIAFIAVVLWRYAAGNVDVLELAGYAPLTDLGVYVTILLCGGLLVLFLIKPLVAPRLNPSVEVTLSRHDHEAVYRFVDELARALGAPAPRRIAVTCDVNASAGLEYGWLGLLGSRPVLHIGLPLMAGMTVRQLGGVVAHELGHFSQGAAMRFTYIIRSVNQWLASIAYERDAWDQSLAEASAGNVVFQILLLPTTMVIEIVRPILKLLMLTGHLVSLGMSRQMELDADRYMALVVGSDQFKTTMDRLNELSAAWNAARADLQAAWDEGRLCDDLPLLIANHDQEVRVEVRSDWSATLRSSRTSWFDTHPDDAARIAAANRGAAPGIIACDLPATVLVDDFAGVCREATAELHEEMFGQTIPQHQLCQTTQLIAAHLRRRHRQAAMRRWFDDLVDPRRPVFPNLHTTSAGEQLESINEQEAMIAAGAGQVQDAVRKFDTADRRALLIAQVEVLRANDGSIGEIQDADIRQANDAELHELGLAEARKRGEAVIELDSALAPALRRLERAIQIRLESERPDETMDFKNPGARALLGALDSLERAHVHAESLRLSAAQLGALLAQIEVDENSALLLGAALIASRRCCELMRLVAECAEAAYYPYDHAGGRVKLAWYLVPWIGSEEEVSDVYQSACSTLELYYGLYLRLMADLVAHAEAGERSPESETSSGTAVETAAAIGAVESPLPFGNGRAR